MIYIYKLNKDIIGRTAAQLSWQLNQVDTVVNVVSNRLVNGKSLVGLLSAELKAGQEIKIGFDDAAAAGQIKIAFDEVGEML